MGIGLRCTLSLECTKSVSVCLNFRSSDGTAVCFLDKSPLLLVCVSKLEEPSAIIRMQLVILHAQILSLLTSSGLEAVYNRNPGYDLRKLLNGSQHILSRLIDSFLRTPACLLGSYPSFAMDTRERHGIAEALQSAVRQSKSVFGMVIKGEKVVTVAGDSWISREWDIILVLNFIAGNASLQQSETLTTLCLPFYESSGNLISYIQYITDSDVCVVFFSADKSGDISLFSEAFLSVKMACLPLVNEDCVFSKSLLAQIEETVFKNKVQTWYFVFKDSKRKQFVFSGDQTGTSEHEMGGAISVKEIILQYENTRAGMFAHDGEYLLGPLQEFRLEECGSVTHVALCSSKDELYLTLDCIISKQHATEMIQALHALCDSYKDVLFQ